MDGLSFLNIQKKLIIGNITGLFVKINTLYEGVNILQSFDGVEVTSKDLKTTVYNTHKKSDMIHLANYCDLYNGFPIPNENRGKEKNSLVLMLGFGYNEEVDIPSGGIQLELTNRCTYKDKEMFVVTLGIYDVTVNLEQLDILSHYYRCSNFTVRHGKTITVNTK